MGRLSRIGPVSGASVGERVDALIGAFWASRFNQTSAGTRCRQRRLPGMGVRSPRDPLPPCPLNTNPYWRTLRSGRSAMAGTGRASDRAESGTPMPGTAADRQRVPAEVWLKRLAQNAPISASTRSPTLAPLTRTDPRQRSHRRSCSAGGGKERRVERRDRLRPEVRGQPLDLFAHLLTTKTTYGTASR